MKKYHSLFIYKTLSIINLIQDKFLKSLVIFFAYLSKIIKLVSFA